MAVRQRITRPTPTGFGRFWWLVAADGLVADGAGAGRPVFAGWLPAHGDLPPEVTAGGAVGRGMARATVVPMGFEGGVLVLVAITAVGLTLALSIRWSQVFESIGRALETAVLNLAGRASAQPQQALDVDVAWSDRLFRPFAQVWNRFASRSQRMREKRMEKQSKLNRALDQNLQRLGNDPLDVDADPLVLDDLDDWSPATERCLGCSRI